jgi:hypothetical protein
MTTTNRGDSFTYFVSLARSGDSFTLPSSGTVSSSSKPGIDPVAIWKSINGIADTVTDPIWIRLANLTDFKWDKSSEEKENYISDGHGGVILEDSFNIKTKREATATCNQSSPIIEEIHWNTGAQNDASTTLVMDSVQTKYFIVHVEKFSNKLQQVVHSYELYMQATCDSIDDGNPEEYASWEVKFKKLISSIERDAKIPAGSTTSAGAGQILKLADGAITANTLVTVTSATEVATNGAEESPIGVAPSAADSGAEVVVSLLNGGLTVVTMYASEAIDAGDLVYTAATGFVSALSVTPGTYYVVGKALSTTIGAGNIIVAPYSPYPIVVS